MRALNGKLFSAFANGILEPIKKTVISDQSLCLELRGKYVNVYYRGGSIMKINPSRPREMFRISFDWNYLNSEEEITCLPESVGTSEAVELWINHLPALKRAMDNYFTTKIKKDEREFQQLITRDNNFGSIAAHTDYFICDIEYQHKHSRFDMVAVEWPSTGGRSNRTSNGRRLAFVEVKYGDNALSAASGLHEHIRHVNCYASKTHLLTQLKKDMVAVFNQKRSLGLIDCPYDLECFGDEPPLLILALVNHNPDSAILDRLLQDLPESPYIELRIATASFLGYGLYCQGIHSIPDVQKRFGEYVHRTRK